MEVEVLEKPKTSIWIWIRMMRVAQQIIKMKIILLSRIRKESSSITGDQLQQGRLTVSMFDEANSKSSVGINNKHVHKTSSCWKITEDNWREKVEYTILMAIWIRQIIVAWRVRETWERFILHTTFWCNYW